LGSIRARAETGALFLDFVYLGRRFREQTALPDTPANRKRLKKALERIETEVVLGTFDYAKTFGKPIPAVSGTDNSVFATTAIHSSARATGTPRMDEFVESWYRQASVAWRKSYCVTQRGALNRYILPFFGDREVGSISKADVLDFRAALAKVSIRKGTSTLSARRINAVMKPLRQILNEAAERFEFNAVFRNIKPLKMKRSDVNPFTLNDVQKILVNCRPDYRNYFTVRFFTGMRTGEVHGLKWKYIDWEHRLILVRESVVLNEEDDLKTDGSLRDIKMNQLVFDALQAQHQVTGKSSDYVFCNGKGRPVDNLNFINRVWKPMLRNLGIEHRRAYQMRHTAATLWLAAGEAPEWIARQLGHTTTEMLFRVYSRYVPNLTRRDGSAMDRMLAQQISLAPIAAQVERIDIKPAMASVAPVAPQVALPSTIDLSGKKNVRVTKKSLHVPVTVLSRNELTVEGYARPPTEGQPRPDLLPLNWSDMARNYQSKRSNIVG
jgi:integrase